MKWEDIQINSTYRNDDLIYRVLDKFNDFIVTVCWFLNSKTGIAYIIGKDYHKEEYEQWKEVTDYKITNMIHNATYDGKIIKF